eukprot:TRINITY_DN3378_c0_g3_i1.p1 TRINITY_DN3378_c0_g3~~TRINITY_DN3378_c0_g3_i1.p1  ORF type:complete len:428 (-),score=63.04 TRINITY_DN3378_c0_g3_i1:336-1619(-)
MFVDGEVTSSSVESKRADMLDSPSVDASDFVIGGRLRQRCTGRVGEVVRYDPHDHELTFKVVFGDGSLPYADWLPRDALESLVPDTSADGDSHGEDVDLSSGTLRKSNVLSRLSDSTASTLFPAEETIGTARWGYAMDTGPRAKMEDAVVVAERLEPSTYQGVVTELYCVLDGHGGHGAVDFIKRNLAKCISWHQHNGHEKCAAAILRDSFFRLDSALLQALVRAKESYPASDSQKVSSGTCACVATICDSILTVASVGDCRAIICKSGEPAHVTTLTRDHRPDEDAEAARLKECGAEVSCDGYLDSTINVSRAFGDMDFRTDKKFVGMTAEPDVFTHKVDSSTEFLLLACDGIFELMSSHDAATEVRRALRQGSSPHAAARALVSVALEKRGGDNLTAAVVLFNRPSALERTAPRLVLRPRSKKSA